MKIRKVNDANIIQKYSTEILLILFMVILTTGVYYSVRWHDFIHYDDPLYIIDNHHIHNGLTRDGVQWAFFTTRSGSWHPLTWISHMIDISMYGMDPGRHHWTNVQIHLISVVLLFLFFQAATQQRWISALIATCFAIHPLHVESVAWIAERKDVLSICFAHLTLLTYVWYTKKVSHSRRICVLICFVASLMSKPMMITLPFLLCFLDYWPLNRWHHEAAFDLIKEKLPMFVLALVFALFTYFSQKTEHAMTGQLPLSCRIFNAGIVYFIYLFKMMIPVKLAAFYPHPNESVSVLWGLCSITLIVAILIFSIYYRKSLPFVLIGVIWYFFSLLPVIGIIQIGAQQMADRYTYFPMTGAAIVVFFSVYHVFLHKISKWLIHILIVGTILGWTILGWKQVQVWQNSHTLFSQAIANTSDQNIVANLCLANFQMSNNHLNEAITHCKKVLQVAPTHASAMFRLASALTQNNQVDDAIRLYHKILRQEPGNVGCHINLGNIFFHHKKQFALAMNHYRLVLNQMPNSAMVYTSIGNIKMAQKRPEEALKNYIQALTIDPSYLKAFVNLAQLISVTHPKNANILIQCADSLKQSPHANLCFLRLSQLYLSNNQQMLGHFFKQQINPKK